MVLNTEWAQVEIIDLINDGGGLAFGIIGGRSTGVVVKTIIPGGVADRDGRLQSGDHILQIGEVNLRGLGSEQVASVLRQCGVHVRMVVARPIESTSSDYQGLSSHAAIVPTKILGDQSELDKHLADNGYHDSVSNYSGRESAPYIFTGQSDIHSISSLVEVVRNPLPIGKNIPNIPSLQGSIPQSGHRKNVVVDLLPLDMALHGPNLPETETYTVQLRKDDLGLGITVAGYVCEKEEISGIFIKSISRGSVADIIKKIKVNDRILQVDDQSVIGLTNHQAVEVLRKAGETVTLLLERYLRGPKYDQLQQAIKANERVRASSSPLSPSISSLPKIPLSLVKLSSLGIDPEPDSRTSLDFDSAILLDNPVSDENEIIIDTIDGRKSVQFSICSHESIYDKWKDVIMDDAELVIAEMTKSPLSGLGISLEGTVDVEDGQEVRPHHYIRNILLNGPVGKNNILQSGDELLEVNGIRLLGLNHVEVVSILKQLPCLVLLVCVRSANTTRIIDTAQHRDAFRARNILAGSIMMPSNDKMVKAKSDTSIVSSVASESCSLESRSKSLEIINGLPMWSDEETIVELMKTDHGLGFSILDYQDPLDPHATVIVIRSLVPGSVAQADGRLVPGDRLLRVNGVSVDGCTLDRAVQVLKAAPRGPVRIGVAKPLSSGGPNKQQQLDGGGGGGDGSKDSQDTDIDDQTCLEDFQEGIEEYQECLDVMQLCIEDDESALSQLDIINQQISDPRIFIKQISPPHSKIAITELDHSNNPDACKVYHPKTQQLVENDNVPNITTTIKNRVDQIDCIPALKFAEEISERDSFETCREDSLSDEVMKIYDNFEDIDKTPTNSTHNLSDSKNEVLHAGSVQHTNNNEPAIADLQLEDSSDYSDEINRNIDTDSECRSNIKLEINEYKILDDIDDVNYVIEADTSDSNDDCRIESKVTIQEEDVSRMVSKLTIQEEDDSRMESKVTIKEEDDSRMRSNVTIQEDDRMGHKVTIKEEDDSRMGSKLTIQEELAGIESIVESKDLLEVIVKETVCVTSLISDLVADATVRKKSQESVQLDIDGDVDKNDNEVENVTESLKTDPVDHIDLESTEVVSFIIESIQASVDSFIVSSCDNLVQSKKLFLESMLEVEDFQEEIMISATPTNDDLNVLQPEVILGRARTPETPSSDILEVIEEEPQSAAMQSGEISIQSGEISPHDDRIYKSTAYSEPCLKPIDSFQALDFFVDIKDDELKSYDNQADSLGGDQFFLVQYPQEELANFHKEVSKCLSEPAVILGSNPLLDSPHLSFTYRINEYYNDIDECLESFRDDCTVAPSIGDSAAASGIVVITGIGDEDDDDDVEVALRSSLIGRCRSEPDIRDKTFLTLTYDPGPEPPDHRRNSAFVEGRYENYEGGSSNVDEPMTVIQSAVSDRQEVMEKLQGQDNGTDSHMYNKRWGPIKTVQIHREPNTSLGISIVGGKVDLCANESPTETVLGIFIKNVVANSPAGKAGQLQTGDRILEVSGVDLRNVSHEKAVEVIRYAKNPIIFIIQSIVPLNIEEFINATQHKSYTPQIKETSILDESNNEEIINAIQHKSNTPQIKETSLSDESNNEKIINAIQHKTNTPQTKKSSLLDKLNNDAIINEAPQKSNTPQIMESSLPEKLKTPCDERQDRLTSNKSVEFSEKLITSEPVIPKVEKSIESSDESDDDEDVREMAGRTRSSQGHDIDRASAANVKRTKQEITEDPETEDDFGYTSNKVKKKYANLGESIQMVQLERGGQGLGLSLAGHKDRSCMAVFVCGINPAGAAFRTGGIQLGDEILEVNGVVLHGRCHLNASAIIKGLSGPIFKIIILRRKAAIDDIAVRPITQFPTALSEEASEDSFSHYPNVRTISIKKGTQSLGIMIIEGKHADVGQGIFISDIQEGSSAEKAGLEIGEMILAVNKDSLLGSNYDTAANLLKRTEGLVNLVVANPGKRPVSPTTDGANKNNANNNKCGLKAVGQPSRPTTPVPEPPVDPSTSSLHPGKDTTIEITTDNQGLGFFFIGGKDTQIQGGIVIVEIFSNGAASKDNRLQAGDQILEVNGISIKDVTHNTASQALRQTLPKMKLVVYRPEKLNYQTVESEFVKKPGKGLGLSIMARKSGKGVYISEILNGGCADVEGKILKGDIIASINGHSIDNSSVEEAGALLKTATGKVALKLNRYKPMTR